MRSIWSAMSIRSARSIRSIRLIRSIRSIGIRSIRSIRFIKFIRSIRSIWSIRSICPPVIWHPYPGARNSAVKNGLYRTAWSPNPMEASSLGLGSATVLSRALLEVSPATPTPLRGDDNNNNNKQQQPSVHRQAPVDIAPRVVRPILGPHGRSWFPCPFWCWADSCHPSRPMLIIMSE